MGRLIKTLAISTMYMLSLSACASSTNQDTVIDSGTMADYYISHGGKGGDVIDVIKNYCPLYAKFPTSSQVNFYSEDKKTLIFQHTKYTPVVYGKLALNRWYKRKDYAMGIHHYHFKDYVYATCLYELVRDNKNSVGVTEKKSHVKIYYPVGHKLDILNLNKF